MNNENNTVKNNFSTTKLTWILGVIFLILGISMFINKRLSDFEPLTPATPTVFIVLSTSTPDSVCQSSEKVLDVYQEGNTIIVKNISISPIVARISWDGKDPYGNGTEGSDSFVSSLEPNQSYSQDIKSHVLADVWAWNSESGDCVGQSSIIINK